MIALIVSVLFGISFAFFATQNTIPTTIVISSFSWSGIPLYLIVLVSLLIGIMVAWVINLSHTISTYLASKQKREELSELKRTTAELTRRVHKVDLELTKIKEGNGQSDEKSL